VSLWLIDNRKRLGHKPADVAARVGVSETTVRGWEAGRSIGASSVAALEGYFGVEAPREREPVNLDDLVAAMRELIAELRAEREARSEWERGLLEGLRDIAQLAARQGDHASEPRAAAHR
jgi:transcriptional regulator with XRE-family HTH domain